MRKINNLIYFIISKWRENMYNIDFDVIIF